MINKTVPIFVLETMVIKLLEFPYPQICRHSIVCDLLSIIEEHGGLVSHELAQAVTQANDEKALELLLKKSICRKQ